jgi:two-component system, NarL family, response regulator NreC
MLALMTVDSPGHEGDITVVLADDHAVVRKGLRLLVDAEPDLRVVAEAGTLPDALRMAGAHRPAVIVLDLNMPGGSSLDAIPAMLELAPTTAIVVLTMQDEPSFARRALQAGALGFVLKDAAEDELLGAIRLAAEGETYLNPRLGARLATQPPESAGAPDELSKREVEVLKLIALGHTNAEIAGQLYLSVRTVESHRAHIQQKTLQSSRAELVQYALAHGFVDVETLSQRSSEG